MARFHWRQCPRWGGCVRQGHGQFAQSIGAGFQGETAPRHDDWTQHLVKQSLKKWATLSFGCLCYNLYQNSAEVKKIGKSAFRHKHTCSCFLLKTGGGSLILHHVPGDKTAGWATKNTQKDTECPQHMFLQMWAVKMSKAADLLMNTVKNKVTCDFKSCLAVGNLQRKEPSEKFSNWRNWHQGPAQRFRNLTNRAHVQTSQKIYKPSELWSMSWSHRKN